MNVGFKLTYVHLISHTFPGLLLVLEIVLAFKLFTLCDLFDKILKTDLKATNFVILLIFLYAISTLLGIVIDAIRHRILRKCENKMPYNDIFQFIMNKVN